MPTYSNATRQYVWLCLLGLALGWFEASIVVYLRELYYPDGFRFPLVIVWDRIAFVEVVREAASILLLAAAARLAARHFLARFACFMILFGLWDLVYYAVLKVMLGWPASLWTWDILFLIPVPWTGPVWAPCVVAVVLVSAGTYLYWTADRPRAYARWDWMIEIGAGLLVIGAFVSEWRAVLDQRVPQYFPAWLFWVGVVLGVSWFIVAERRDAASRA